MESSLVPLIGTFVSTSSPVERERPSGAREDPGDARLQQELLLKKKIKIKK